LIRRRKRKQGNDSINPNAECRSDGGGGGEDAAMNDFPVCFLFALQTAEEVSFIFIPISSFVVHASLDSDWMTRNALEDEGMTGHMRNKNWYKQEQVFTFQFSIVPPRLCS